MYAFKRFSFRGNFFNLFLLILFFNIDVAKTQSTCLTPTKQQSRCININECSQLLEVLRKPKPLAQSDLNLLHESQCGFDEQNLRIPKVCCPDRNATENGITPLDVTSKHLEHREHRNSGRINYSNCGKIDLKRIFGGNKTNLFEFPWMALISYQSNGRLSFRCGGTLINDRYILTAAHCISNLPTGIVLAGVRLGEHNIGTEKDCQKFDRNKEECAPPVQDFTIEKVIPYPQFSPTKFTDDIGLLKLGAIPDFTKKNIGTICLPVGSLAQFNEGAGIVAGWGASENGKSSLDLLKVKLSIVQNSKCESIYSGTKQSKVITHRQLCAEGLNGRDSCQGDSGGPFMYAGTVHNTAAYVQHGIVSFGPRPCATEGKPGVYTRVVHYLDWILDNID